MFEDGFQRDAEDKIFFKFEDKPRLGLDHIELIVFFSLFLRHFLKLFFCLQLLDFPKPHIFILRS